MPAKARPDLGAALATAARWLDEVPGVVGVGRGYSDGAPALDVWVNPGTVPAGRLPSRLFGVPVRVHGAGGPSEAS
ncbi:hypothetical protein ACFWY9_30895 [Amycolatopsis sp. NPDC059027]|uniref:hypothetical protein n=1 Tax=unclassified Amycolatopsis TaxID=2618356 RepID=UPI00366FEF86